MKRRGIEVLPDFCEPQKISRADGISLNCFIYSKDKSAQFRLALLSALVLTIRIPNPEGMAFDVFAKLLILLDEIVRSEIVLVGSTKLELYKYKKRDK